MIAMLQFILIDNQTNGVVLNNLNMTYPEKKLSQYNLISN